MPYAFAHPAAVIPVARLLGPRAVPSALAIGSMVPDAWYFMPGITRAASHDMLGALWFCLPVGLALYAAFHLVFKEPMLSLMPRRLAGRLAAWSTPGLPSVSWFSVVISILAGVATHLVWDALTHQGYVRALEATIVEGVPVRRLLQHLSTVLGLAFLVWWLVRKLRERPPRSGIPQLEPRLRAAVGAAMVVIPLAAFCAVLQAIGIMDLREGVRVAGVTSVSAFGVVALFFSLAWKWASPKPLAPRRRGA